MPRTYLVTVQHVVDKVRTLTNDATTPYRASDSEILGWVNDAISSVLTIYPQLFTTIWSHTLTAGSRQTVINSRSQSIVDVIGLIYADYASMNVFSPGWQTSAVGTPVNWLRAIGEPLDFWVYPPASGGGTLSILGVEKPAKLTATTDAVPLPEAYEPALVAYCVAMVESKDDEHVDSQRAAQAMTDFVGRIKGGA